MNKEEFLRQLEVQLSGVPENEKQEALQYYRDYFEDAGEDKESEVLKSLGSPADVAKSIREENGAGEYTENGYRVDVPNSSANAGNNAKKDDSTLIAVILIILLSPLWFPVFTALCSFVIGLVAGFIAFAVSGGAMILASIASVIGSVIAMIAGLPVPVGLMWMGAGLVVGALGVLFILLTVVICKYLIPWLVGEIKKFWNFIFKRKGAAK